MIIIVGSETLVFISPVTLHVLCAQIMAALILKHQSQTPESNVSSTLALLPSEMTAASGCTGTGSSLVSRKVAVCDDDGEDGG